MSETVTIKEQRTHMRKITMLAKKIDKRRDEIKGLTDADLNILKRALACHWAVIKLDVERRKEAGDEQ